MKLFAALVVLSAGLYLVLPISKAYAQTPPDEGYAFPLVDPAFDDNSVDMARGLLQAAIPGVSIGDPEAGGLSYTQVFTGDDWRHSIGAAIKVVGSEYTVNFMGGAEVFTQSGSTYTPERPSGSTLTYSSGNYTYTLADGTVAVMSTTVNGESLDIFGGNEAVVVSIVRPNGDRMDYGYRSVMVSYNCGTWEEPEICQAGPYVRPQSVVSNRGYQLHFQYERDAQPTNWQNHLVPWWTSTGVILFNMTEEYCAPTATYSSCSFLQTWPTLTFQNVSSTVRTYTDTLGRVTRITRNTGGAVTGIRYPGSTSDDVTVSYSSGRVSSVNVNGLTTSYAYADASGTRTTSIDAPGAAGTTEIQSSLSTGLVSSVENAVGQTTNYTYNSNRQLTRVTAPEGNYTNFTYDARGNITEVRQVAKSGSGLADIVTTASYPSTCSNPRTCNQPTWVRDAAGNQTDFTYNSTHGGLLTATQPAPSGGADRPQTRISYQQFYAYYKDHTGSIVQAPSGVYLPRNIYSCRTGEAPSCQNTANEQRIIHYYGSTGVANNLQLTSINERGNDGSFSATTVFTYDVVGNLRSVDPHLHGTNNRTFYHYDALRRPVGEVGPDPDGSGALVHRAQRITYNTRGLTTQIEFGTVTDYSDSAWNNFTQIERQTVSYDAAGRMTHTRLQTGSTTHALIQHSYDNANRLDCVAQRMNPATYASPPTSACTLATAGSDGSDRISRTSYDVASRRTQVVTAYGTSAASTEAAWTYTNNGQVATLTDGMGNRTTYIHDGFDRLYEQRYPSPTQGSGTSSTSDYERYIYDAYGRVSSRRTRSGQSFSYSYDNLNRVTAVTAPSGTTSTSYTYDNHGRILTVSGGGQTLTNTYNSRGWLASQTGANGVVSYQYDALGRRTRMTWPDSFYVTYVYNQDHSLASIRENGSSSWAQRLAQFDYDQHGRRWRTRRGNDVTTTMDFDAMGRLAELAQDLAGTANDRTLAFTHNPAGQIASRTDNNSAYAWTDFVNFDEYATHNGLNQILSLTGQSNPAYDARGNMTSQDGRSFGYDQYNRLTTVSGGIDLSYDPAGRLHETSGTGVVFRRFQYDGLDLIAEYNGSGTLQMRYVHGPGSDEVLVQYTGSGTSNREWLIADERGSIVAHTNNSGARTQTNTYDTYGQPGSGNAGRFGYTGQVWLPETGLYHYKNRAYNPAIGRFMQADPIGVNGGMNLYAYVGGDPVNFTDPLGLIEDVLVEILVVLRSRTCIFCSNDVPVYSNGAFFYNNTGGGGFIQIGEDVVGNVEDEGDCRQEWMDIGNGMAEWSNRISNISGAVTLTGGAALFFPEPASTAAAPFLLAGGVIGSYTGAALHIGSGIVHGNNGGTYQNAYTGTVSLVLGGGAGRVVAGRIVRERAWFSRTYGRILDNRRDAVSGITALGVVGALDLAANISPVEQNCEASE